MLKLEQIEKELCWVGKLTNGNRKVGTYDEVKAFLDRNSDMFDDIDLCCKQPDHLQQFVDNWLKYDSDNKCFTTLEEYYKIYCKNS